jgi:hypothetical protein
MDDAVFWPKKRGHTLNQRSNVRRRHRKQQHLWLKRLP